MIEVNGNLRVEKSDFVKHGYIGTYTIGECRCELCQAAWDRWDVFKSNESRRLAARAPKRTQEALRKAKYRARISSTD